ncbi:MAG: arginine--tRNA ligase [Cellvibrionaceae bacterium]|nr:arginine--tRNA ligase [Cellvibrionaceae bacterium]
MNIRELLNERVRCAMSDAGIPPDLTPNVTVSKNSDFGDYQANGAMAAAKSMKSKPRDVAKLIVDNLDLSGVAEKLEIAGPGFINIHLDPQWLAKQLYRASKDSKLGINTKATPLTVVIDYSAPNLAKEMHVGHLRSTIIGDAMARVLHFLGDTVIKQNHVGDWGTQFGMLICELENNMSEGQQVDLALKDLETFYQQAKKHFDEDEQFAKKSREYVVKLQSGDPGILKLWQHFKEVSLRHSHELYLKLNVSLSEKDVRGESAYNDQLGDIVTLLLDNGIAVEDRGAKVAFLEELADKNGDPSPVIIQKKDGGYLYATTDLAAINFRVNQLKADRVLYFIDARQSLHMQQVFTIAKKANIADQWVSLEHHAFGTMLGEDGKPFKTRSGGTVKLIDLIEEAKVRAEEVVRQKNTQLSDDEIQTIAEKVGIGAIKYADLSKTRTNDYIFNWNNMLSFEGNTAPYLQYAYARICSIFRKAEINIDNFSYNLTISQPQEKALVIKTLQFSEVVNQVSADAFPHILCNYLYDLTSLFMSFYESCPILKEGVIEAEKDSRLQISKIVAQTLKQGLYLLGIDVMEKM